MHSYCITSYKVKKIKRNFGDNLKVNKREIRKSKITINLFSI